MAERLERPAYYAARSGGKGDWWTLLHPPYTAWHLSYAVIGACLAPSIATTNLAATVAAFFLAVGIGAHSLDELNGRPLRTRIPSVALISAAAIGIGGAVAIGAAGVARVGAGLIPFIITGTFLVLAYNLELFGGRFHNDFVFAGAWGAFPVLTAYYAQAEDLAPAALLAAAGAFALSSAQRTLSTPARRMRRKVRRVEGSMTFEDGTMVPLDGTEIIRPLETALKSLSWATVMLAFALLAARLL